MKKMVPETQFGCRKYPLFSTVETVLRDKTVRI